MVVNLSPCEEKFATYVKIMTNLWRKKFGKLQQNLNSKCGDIALCRSSVSKDIQLPSGGVHCLNFTWEW